MVLNIRGKQKLFSVNVVNPEYKEANLSIEKLGSDTFHFFTGKALDAQIELNMQQVKQLHEVLTHLINK